MEKIKKVTVYRLEDNTGNGPFNTKRQFINMILTPLLMQLLRKRLFSDGLLLVAPEQDVTGYDELKDKLKYFSGVENRKLIKVWFKELLIPLKELDFKLVRYDVPAKDVIKGNSGLQVIFRKENAKRTELKTF